MRGGRRTLIVNHTFREGTPFSAICLAYAFTSQHGSLDWFEVGGKIVRCPIDPGEVPIIITPGATKYRQSFRWAFDDQRNAGNRAVSNATRLMFIGYIGFNDDHLEQYLCPNLTLTKPTVIVTKDKPTVNDRGKWSKIA